MGYKELVLNSLRMSLEEDSEDTVGVVDDGTATVVVAARCPV